MACIKLNLDGATVTATTFSCAMTFAFESSIVSSNSDQIYVQIALWEKDFFILRCTCFMVMKYLFLIKKYQKRKK